MNTRGAWLFDNLSCFIWRCRMKFFALAVFFVVAMFFVSMGAAQAMSPDCTNCSLTFADGGSDYSQWQLGGFAVDGNSFLSVSGGGQENHLWSSGSGEFSGETFLGQGSSQSWEISGGTAYQSSGSFLRNSLQSGIGGAGDN